MFGAAPSGFEAQWQQFLTYAYPAIQIVFWLVVGYAALAAVRLYKRYVDHVTGSAADKAEEKAVSVAEFVE